MTSVVDRLDRILRSVQPPAGYESYHHIVDVLNAESEALAAFRGVLQKASAEELDRAPRDSAFGLLTLLAADALDLLPDDSRLFQSPTELAALQGADALKALTSACIVNDVAAVEALATRVDLNQLDHNQQTALCYAVGNNHAKCVEVLLENGADPNVIGHHGATAVHDCASSVSSKEIFRMLIEAGGSLHTKNHEGETPTDILEEMGRADWALRGRP